MKILILVASVGINLFVSNPYVILPPHIPIYGNNFEQDCINYNIQVDEGWDIVFNGSYPLTFKKVSNVKTASQTDDHVIYQTDIYHAILRYEESNNYSYICRMLLDPVCNSSHINPDTGNPYVQTTNFTGINISLDLNTELYDMGAWAPMTQPNVVSGSVSSSIGTDGASISASANYAYTLDVEARVSPTSGHFEIDYSYRLANDEYNNYATVYYAMFNFVALEEFDISNFPLVSFETIYEIDGISDLAEFNARVDYYTPPIDYPFI